MINFSGDPHAIVTHLENPYSEDSLQVSPKDYLDLGEFAVKRGGQITTGLIKGAGEDAPTFTKWEAPGIVEAHDLMLDAFRAIAGDEEVRDSKIYFTHYQSYVPKGNSQLVGTNHTDGSPSHPTIRLIGVFHDVLPTIVIDNPTVPEDFGKNGELLSVEGAPVEEVKLIEKELPTNRLLIISPSTPHRGQQAPDYVQSRTFMRWQMHRK